MHHGMLVKINGKNVEEAKARVRSIFEETLACGHCGASKYNINWDYVGEIFNLVERDGGIREVKENGEFKIFREDFDKKGFDTFNKVVKYYLAMRKGEEKYLVKRVKKELKAYNLAIKKTKVLPTYTMLNYCLEELESIRHVIKYGEIDDHEYTLHCTNNHYVDLTDGEDGKVFYFWVDRHF